MLRWLAPQAPRPCRLCPWGRRVAGVGLLNVHGQRTDGICHLLGLHGGAMGSGSGGRFGEPGIATGAAFTRLNWPAPRAGRRAAMHYFVGHARTAPHRRSPGLPLRQCLAAGRHRPGPGPVPMRARRRVAGRGAVVSRVSSHGAGPWWGDSYRFASVAPVCAHLARAARGDACMCATSAPTIRPKRTR